ncbi:MAG: WG repeat-containing protein [Casimicrobiaceae bacterium]
MAYTCVGSLPRARWSWTGWRRFAAATAAVALSLPGSGCGRQTPADGPLFPAPDGARWGYIDGRGKTAIKPRFEDALPFSEGMAAVKADGHWGYIDRSGTQVIPSRYRAAQEFRNGVAVVDAGVRDHPLGIIDTTGGWVVEPAFRSLKPGNGPDGLLLGQKEAGQGFAYYDRDGNLVHGPYELAFPFAEGRARVRLRGRDMLVDAAGSPAPGKALVLDGIAVADGMIAVRSDRKLGYMNLAGKVTVEPRYDQGGAFAEGLAPVQSEGHWMFIDKEGAVTAELPGGVVFAYPLSDGLSLVTADRDTPGRKFGYVDRNGKWVVKPMWDEAEPFRNGLARVGIWKGGKMAYIDRAGKIVFEHSGVDLNR